MWKCVGVECCMFGDNSGFRNCRPFLEIMKIAFLQLCEIFYFFCELCKFIIYISQIENEYTTKSRSSSFKKTFSTINQTWTPFSGAADIISLGYIVYYIQQICFSINSTVHMYCTIIQTIEEGFIKKPRQTIYRLCFLMENGHPHAYIYSDCEADEPIRGGQGQNCGGIFVYYIFYYRLIGFPSNVLRQSSQ